MPQQAEEALQVSVWREFNRFYTARLGLLRGRYMGMEFSLTESRMLYELMRQPGLTATALRRTLELDGGYISRLLSSLTRKGLIAQAASPRDAREKLLTLTGEGLEVARRLDVRSSEELQKLLNPLEEHHRRELVVAVTAVREILSSADKAVRIVRAAREQMADARLLLTEYYELIQVVQRDTPAAIRKGLTGEKSGFWIAYVGETPAGCVALRPLPSIPGAAECKRLYVRAEFRGKGLAKLLMDTVEAFATELGLDWVYLDTKDDLEVAIEMYHRRGYEPCERYNDNPQATIFLRKTLKR